MKLLRNTKKMFIKIKNVPKLESVEVVLVHCNLVNNNYQQASKVLFSFARNKQFDHLINISPHSLTILNIANTECSFIDAWFTDQNSKQLEIEDNVNMTLIIIKIRYSLEPRYRKYVEGYGFLSFSRKLGDKYGKKINGCCKKNRNRCCKNCS